MRRKGFNGFGTTFCVLAICLCAFFALPAAGETADETLLLSFVGDCSIGDAVQSTGLETSFTATVREKGFDWPFSLIRGYFEEDDLTFANLEVVLTKKRSLKADKMYPLIADPEHIAVLTGSSVEVVNTVNNHCLDFSEAGYADSLAVLDEAGVLHFGTLSSSDILGITEVKGVKIGMVGYSYPQDYDLKKITTRMNKLRDEGCDLVIVSLHWGRETHMTPETWQYAYAKQLIDAGADVIWGHHAHVVQPVAFYKGKPIFFNTGNFTFGSMSQVDPSTGIFQLSYRVDREGKPILETLRVIPCRTGERGDFRPFELTDPAERKACLAKLVFKKSVKGLTDPPASFLESGIVRLNGDGTVVE